MDIRTWASVMLSENAVIIDTETTGLDDIAQVIEVAAISGTGEILLDTLVRPWSPPTMIVPENVRVVPAVATAIHGITDAMLVNAPSWLDVHSQLSVLVRRRPVVIYNSAFDVRLLQQSAELVGLGDPLQWAATIDCAMLAYAEHRGVWIEDEKRFKRHKLTAAVAYEGIDVSGIQAHRALGDCRMTLELIRAMANNQEAA